MRIVSGNPAVGQKTCGGVSPKMRCRPRIGQVCRVPETSSVERTRIAITPAASGKVTLNVAPESELSLAHAR